MRRCTGSRTWGIRWGKNDERWFGLKSGKLSQTTAGTRVKLVGKLYRGSTRQESSREKNLRKFSGKVGD